jgi:hypothetical protein
MIERLPASSVSELDVPQPDGPSRAQSHLFVPEAQTLDRDRGLQDGHQRRLIALNGDGVCEPVLEQIAEIGCARRHRLREHELLGGGRRWRRRRSRNTAAHACRRTPP